MIERPPGCRSGCRWRWDSPPDRLIDILYHADPWFGGPAYRIETDPGDPVVIDWLAAIHAYPFDYEAADWDRAEAIERWVT